jgi:putative spermidine/putrescine transport system substrate-binding protein
MAKMRFVILFALFFAFVLSACSPQATPTEPAAPPAAPTDTAAPAAPQLAESIVLTNTGGDWGACQRTAFADTFEEKYGVTVIDGPFLDDGQIMAAVESGAYDADVLFPTPSLVLDELGAKYLEPIDYNLVPEDELIPGTYATARTPVPPRQNGKTSLTRPISPASAAWLAGISPPS